MGRGLERQNVNPRETQPWQIKTFQNEFVLAKYKTKLSKHRKNSIIDTNLNQNIRRKKCENVTFVFFFNLNLSSSRSAVSAFAGIIILLKLASSYNFLQTNKLISTIHFFKIIIIYCQTISKCLLNTLRVVNPKCCVFIPPPNFN